MKCMRAMCYTLSQSEHCQTNQTGSYLVIPELFLTLLQSDPFSYTHSKTLTLQGLWWVRWTLLSRRSRGGFHRRWLGLLFFNLAFCFWLFWVFWSFRHWRYLQWFNLCLTHISNLTLTSEILPCIKHSQIRTRSRKQTTYSGSVALTLTGFFGKGTNGGGGGPSISSNSLSEYGTLFSMFVLNLGSHLAYRIVPPRPPPTVRTLAATILPAADLQFTNIYI